MGPLRLAKRLSVPRSRLISLMRCHGVKRRLHHWRISLLALVYHVIIIEVYKALIRCILLGFVRFIRVCFLLFRANRARISVICVYLAIKVRCAVLNIHFLSQLFACIFNFYF